MKPLLYEIVLCPECSGVMQEKGHNLTCQACGHSVALQGGIPLFTPAPGELRPSDKIDRGPEIGTPWRQANWRFLTAQVNRLPPDAIILDVGAGRGDFATLLEGRRSLALDVYPYPEVDLVCDLTQVNPFRPDGVDAVLLMNVMEHVYDTHALLGSLARLLRPGGILIVAIPFMVKIHQAPVDFVRYTHFALQRLGEAHGLAVEHLEGYYDPVFFLGEGLGNLRWGVLPTLNGAKRRTARLLLAGIGRMAGALDRVIGGGRLQPPDGVRSMAPTGYHIIYRKV